MQRRARFTESGSRSHSKARPDVPVYRSQLSHDYQYDHLFKILICGDSSVGKTSVLNRFVSNKFRVAHIRTNGVDFMMKYVTIRDKKIQLKIWDTAGQEEYDAITEQYFRRAQGVLLAYDITNQKSFDHLQIWIKKLKERVDDKVPIVLLGNKVDLGNQRRVYMEQGIQFAQTQNMPFFETSCLTSVNVTEAVHCLVERILLQIDLPKPTSKPSPEPSPETSPGYEPAPNQFNSIKPCEQPPASNEQTITPSQEPIPPIKKGCCSC